MVHLSRMSEELILWSSSEFGFIELPDSFATGSSIMPQKKNPDVPELVRGKTGRVFGDLISLLTMMKALPLSYNRDMQEDKTALFQTIDILTQCIEIYIKMLPKLKTNTEAMERATATGFLNATDMADYLVADGMPFREAHSCVGEAVAYASSKKKELHELTLKELKSFSSHFKKDIFKILTTDQMINRRKSTGGTALKCVKAAIKEAERALANKCLK
jgi:argininosuccinate lyase